MYSCSTTVVTMSLFLLDDGFKHTYQSSFLISVDFKKLKFKPFGVMKIPKL